MQGNRIYYRSAAFLSRALLLSVGVACSILIANLSLAQDDVSADLKFVVENEVKEARTRWEISPEILYGNGIYAEVTKDQKVIIGKQFLQQIALEIDESLRNVFLRFMILHELWHVKQFQLYGLNISEVPGEMKKVYECQADMMASYTLDDAVLQIAMDSPNPKQELANLKDSREKLFHAITKYSSSEKSKDIYLTEYERWTALRFGALRAAYGKANPGAKSSREHEMLLRLSRAINWQAGIDNAAWSLEMCKKITRYGKDIFRSIEESVPKSNDNLTAYSENGIQHTSTMSFKNKSNRRVRISVTAVSGFYPQGSGKDYSVHSYHDGFSGAVDIEPGDIGAITGQYYWVTGSGDEIFIREWGFVDETLISAEYIGPPVSPMSCNDGLAVVTDAQELKLLANLIRIAGTARDSFSDIPKELLFDAGGYRYYKITMAIPGAQAGNILINRDGSAVAHIHFYEGSDFTAATESYNKFVKTMRRPCLAAKVKVTEKVEKESSSTDFSTITAFSSGHVALSKKGPDKNNKSKPPEFAVILYINPAVR